MKIAAEFIAVLVWGLLEETRGRGGGAERGEVGGGGGGGGGYSSTCANKIGTGGVSALVLVPVTLGAERHETWDDGSNP